MGRGRFRCSRRTLGIVTHTTRNKVHSTLDVLSRILSFNSGGIALSGTLLIAKDIAHRGLVGCLDRIRGRRAITKLRAVRTVLSRKGSSGHLLRSLVGYYHSLLLCGRTPRVLRRANSIVVSSRFGGVTRGDGPRALCQCVSALGRRRRGVHCSVRRSICLRILAIGLTGVSKGRHRTDIRSLRVTPRALGRLGSLRERIGRLGSRIGGLLNGAGHKFSSRGASEPTGGAIRHCRVGVSITDVCQVLNDTAGVSGGHFFSYVGSVLDALGVSSETVFGVYRVRTTKPRKVVLDFGGRFVYNHVVGRREIHSRFRGDINHVCNSTGGVICIPGGH